MLYFKRLSATIVFLFLFQGLGNSPPVYASDWAAAVKGGLSRASQTVGGDNLGGVDLSDRSGLVLSVHGERRITERVWLYVGTSFIQKGYKSRVDGFDSSVEIDYLQVPVGFRFKESLQHASLFLLAGIFTAFELSNDGIVGPSQEQFDLDQTTNDFDSGLIFGMGVEFPVRETLSLLAETRLDFGLMNINSNESAPNVRNQAFVFLIGVTYYTSKS